MKRIGMFAVLALVAVVAAGCMGSSDKSSRRAAIGSSTPVSGQGSITFTSSLGTQPAFAVQSWDWGVENTTTVGSATSGAGAGKASFKEFQIQKNIDNVSPTLFRFAVEGRNISSLTFKVGTLLTYTFSPVWVTDVEQSGDGNDGNEKVTFVYGKLQTSNTVAGTTASYCWDIVYYKAC